MKLLTVLVVSAIVGSFAFVGGYFAHTALAQQNSNVAPNREKLPPDVFSETLNRSPRATRDEFTTDQDKQAFDLAVAGGPGAYVRWNGIRLHSPRVHTLSRSTIQTLDKEDEARYRSLAMLIGAHESKSETDWFHHERLSVKDLPREVLDVLKNNKDTKGLEEKDAAVIQFSREMFERPEVSSKTFANMERLFGRRGTYALVETMIYFDGSGYLLKAYDQHLDPNDKYDTGPSK